MKTRIMEFLNDEEGATAIEYALIAALIAVALITALDAFGTDLAEFFTDLGGKLDITP